MHYAELIQNLEKLYPHYSFVASSMFRWSPTSKTIDYIGDVLTSIEGRLLLVHEIGHAQANHSLFNSDIDLLKKEVEAWTYAKGIAKKCNINFDEVIAERCLDTYRAWLDKRSTCPDCAQTGYQKKDRNYKCLNCGLNWKVSSNQATRVCRVVAR